MNKGGFGNGGYPRRQDRGGDRVKWFNSTGLQANVLWKKSWFEPYGAQLRIVLKKGSSRVEERHHSTSLTGFDEERPRFQAGTTGFFAVEDNTSCDDDLCERMTIYGKRHRYHLC